MPLVRNTRKSEMILYFGRGKTITRSLRVYAFVVPVNAAEVNTRNIENTTNDDNIMIYRTAKTPYVIITLIRQRRNEKKQKTPTITAAIIIMTFYTSDEYAGRKLSVRSLRGGEFSG